MPERRETWLRSALVTLLVVLGCDSADVRDCGFHGRRVGYLTEQFCVYAATDVAAAGARFRCPVDAPHRVDVERGVVCSPDYEDTAESIAPAVCDVLGGPCSSEPDAGPPPGCGDYPMPGEECDDANDEPLDGCVACRVLPSFVVLRVSYLVDEQQDGIDEQDRARWCDLTGDGAPDNALAPLGQAALEELFAHELDMLGRWSALVIDGLDTTALSSMRGGDDTIQASFVVVEHEIGLAPPGTLYPPSRYYAVEESIDDSGRIPVAATSFGPNRAIEWVADRLVTATVRELGPARVDIVQIRGSGTLTNDGLRDATVCGVLTLRALAGAGLAAPLLRGGVIRSTPVPPVAPDIDVDHDGLETFVVRDGTLECTDGDGTIIGRGDDCPTDPRVADGFSVVLGISADPWPVLGTRPRVAP